MIGYRQPPLQDTQAVNLDSIQNSAEEKISYANLINLSKVRNLGYSCKSFIVSLSRRLKIATANLRLHYPCNLQNVRLHFYGCWNTDTMGILKRLRNMLQSYQLHVLSIDWVVHQIFRRRMRLHC